MFEEIFLLCIVAGVFVVPLVAVVVTAHKDRKRNERLDASRAVFIEKVIEILKKEEEEKRR